MSDMYHLLVFAISMASMTTDARMPGLDITCSSISEKYQQYWWSCGPPSCIDAHKTSHNLLLPEKVLCDKEGKICCPSEYKVDVRSTTRTISATTSRSTNRLRQQQRKKNQNNRTRPLRSSIRRSKTDPSRKATWKPSITKVTTSTPPVDADLEHLDNLIFGNQSHESNSIEQLSDDPSRLKICERCTPSD